LYDRDNSPLKSKDERTSPTQKKDLKEGEALPMIIGSSYKNKTDYNVDNRLYKGKFDPHYLLEYLNRYNVNMNALDGNSYYFNQLITNNRSYFSRRKTKK